MHISLITFIAFFGVISSISNAFAALTLDSTEGNTLIFKREDGTKIRTTTQVSAPKFLGFLDPKAEIPYAVIDGDKSLFLQRVDGTLKTELIPPGKITDSKTGIRALDSTAYYGKCLRDRGPVFVAYQIETVDRRKHKRKIRSVEASTLVIEPLDETPPRFEEKLTEVRSVGKLQSKRKETLALVKKQECFEITAKNRIVDNRPLNLRPHLGASENEDEVDDAPEKSGEKPGDKPGDKSEAPADDKAKEVIKAPAKI